MRVGGRRAMAVVLAMALAGSGCAGRWAYRQGRAEARKGNWDMAVARLNKALQHDPDNIDYKLALDNARIQASRSHHHEALKLLARNDLDAAADRLQIAANYDPANQAYAADLKLTRDKIRRREDERRQRGEFDERMRRAAAQRPPVPTLSPRSPVPISINMPDASLQKIFETLAQLAGVNILFDEAFRDKQTSARLVDVTFQEALDQLTFVNKKFYKVLDQNTIIIAEDNPQMRRRYDESLVQTFYIQNAEPNELTNTLRMMMQRGGTPPQIAPSTGQGLRVITIAGNADEVALAAKLIQALDKPLGEVLVEIEILDVKRSNLKHYGIELANYDGAVTFDPHGSGGNIRAHLLSSLNLADFVVKIPNQLLYRFLQTDSTARILASPRLRGAEGKQTTLRIGTQVPIPVTTFTATQPGANFAPATSFQYRNVGINMELTPRVNAEGEVTFDPIAAEFSLIGQDRDVGGGLKVPEFLTREMKGTLRIRDGETALIGGLIQTEEREAFAGIIGLQSVPILNKVFTSPRKEKIDGEILISVTPHVVRGPKLSDDDLRSFYAGTKETVKVPSARPPLFGTPEPVPSPAAGDEVAPTPAPTTPPVGVSPPEPPVSEEQAEAAAGGPMVPATPAPPEPAPASATPPAAGAAPPMPGGAPSPEPPAEEPNIMVIFSPPEVAIKLGDPPSMMSIIVLRVKELASVEAVVTFDASALEPQDPEPGTLLTLDGKTVSAEKTVDAGRVHMRFSRSEPTAKTPSSGAVAVMRFKGLKPGPTTVTIESLSLITPRGRERVTLPGPGRVVVLP